MRPLYIVTERFDPSWGESWYRYVAWAGLTQLSEVVSLDELLCPSVLTRVHDDDWPYIVNENFMTSYFTDLGHLLRRCGHTRGRNLLCVFREPETQRCPPTTAGDFRYEGCDLVETQGGMSALTNCGGFPLAFSNAELSDHGLIPSLDRAREVQQALRHHYPEDHHANCDVWALFRAA